MKNVPEYLWVKIRKRNALYVSEVIFTTPRSSILSIYLIQNYGHTLEEAREWGRPLWLCPRSSDKKNAASARGSATNFLLPFTFIVSILPCMCCVLDIPVLLPIFNRGISYLPVNIRPYRFLTLQLMVYYCSEQVNASVIATRFSSVPFYVSTSSVMLLVIYLSQEPCHCHLPVSTDRL